MSYQNQIEANASHRSNSTMNSYDVVPSDTVDLPHVPSWIRVTTAGTLVYDDNNGTAKTIVLLEGEKISHHFKRIRATSTDVTGIKAFY
ncbi:MAG: hypothetical protein V4629_03070 [Pseudomonadota bacterium]